MAKRKARPPLEKIAYRIGDKFSYSYLGPVAVVKVHPFGTVDVFDARGRHFRITGLPIYKL